jgi:hypothetical protein
VAYYTYGALGTDRYPPFTLGEAPDYPATLDVAYPDHLSRGLVLVKWWLLALPHYLVLAFFLGGGYLAFRGADVAASNEGWPLGGGLIGLLALIAGVALLFTGRYPSGVFDLLLGLHRWVLRVAAYAALMTDAYPPFRLDLGGDDPGDLPLTVGGRADALATSELAARMPGPGTTPSGTGWSVGRVSAVVVGSLLVVSAVGTAVGGGVLAVADRGGRDAAGFVTTGPMPATTPGYAVLLDPVQLQTDVGGPDLGTILGDVRVSATGSGESAVFVGIGPAADVDAYLAGVGRTRLTTSREPGGTVRQALPGGAPATPPAQQAFWVASAFGPGTQQLTWTAAPGTWTVVVMNSDASRPVAAQLTAGVTAPALRGISTGLLIGAAVALLAGALLIALAVPRSSADRPRS